MVRTKHKVVNKWKDPDHFGGGGVQVDLSAGLDGLVKKGGITFGTGKPLARKPPARLKPGKSIAEMVAEDRR